MNDSPHRSEFSALFAHAEYVRRLARSLLSDDFQTDDVVQQTWLAALARGRGIQDPRAWLTRVVRNFVSERARRSIHRDSRERGAARVEAVADTTRVVEQLEIHRRLVEAVASLDDPYRTTIMLRYLEGRPANEVARQLAVPAETVRTRAHRGLALLREKLDRCYGGDRSKWFRALSPLAGMEEWAVASSVTAPATFTGVVLMAWKFKIFCASLLLAVAAIGWSVYIADSGPESSNAIPDSKAAEVAAVSQKPQVQRSASSPESSSSASARRISDLPRDSEIGARPTPVLSGSVMIIETNGNTSRDVRGWLKIGELGRESETERQIPITSGQWQIEDEHGQLVKVVGLEVVPPAYLDESPLLYQMESPVQLTARRIPPTFLRVVNFDSGHDLSGIEILHVDGWEAGAFFPSRMLSRKVVATNQTSPLELPVAKGRVHYWVRATDHAWRRIQIDHHEGGQQIVKLQRQARLEVATIPVSIPMALELRLYPAGHDDPFAPLMSAAPLDPDGITEFPHLPPGGYQVRAEIGEFFDPPALFALEEVELRAGETKSLTLSLDTHLVDANPVPLAGSLRLPAGLDPSGVDLEVGRAVGPALRPGDAIRLPVHEMQTANLEGTLYRWDAGKVTPGRCKIIIRPFQVVEVIELLDSGNNQVELEVPELATVIVTVVDAKSGEGLAVPWLGWSCFDPVLGLELDPVAGSDAERAIPMNHVPPLEKLGRFEFTAPVGWITVGAGLSGYSENGIDLIVEPGMNQFRLPLEPLPTLVLGFVVDGRILHTAHGFHVKAVDGSEEWRGWWRQGSRYVGTVSQPGLYEIGGVIAGYQPFAPRRVFLDGNERTVVDIPLFPAR